MQTFMMLLQIARVVLFAGLGIMLAILLASLIVWGSDEFKDVRAERRAELRQMADEFHELFMVPEVEDGQYTGRHRYDPNKPSTTLWGQMLEEQRMTAPEFWNEAVA